MNTMHSVLDEVINERFVIYTHYKTIVRCSRCIRNSRMMIQEHVERIREIRPSIYHFWHVFAAEEDVKGHQLRDQGTATVSRVPDGVESRWEVGAGCVHGDRYWCSPALQQRLQIVKERVISVRGVCHAFPASHRHAHRHVIVQYPVIAALCPPRLGRLLVAGHGLPQAHRFARDARRTVPHLGREKERERESQLPFEGDKFAWKAAEIPRIAR